MLPPHTADDNRELFATEGRMCAKHPR
jgi:hypothetical protein